MRRRAWTFMAECEMSFREMVGEFLDFNDMTKAALARRAGVDRSWMSHVLNGRANPPVNPRMLKAIAGVLGLDWRTLLAESVADRAVKQMFGGDISIDDRSNIQMEIARQLRSML